MKKRLLAMLLSVVMLFTLTAPAFAASTLNGSGMFITVFKSGHHFFRQICLRLETTFFSPFCDSIAKPIVNFGIIYTKHALLSFKIGI